MFRAIIFAIILFASAACTNSSGKGVAAIADTSLHNAAASKVLIELFTSQGCSSCPAADKLMGNIAAGDTNIITLSFHVDYWDELGWKDVFSSHDYTLRQQDYVRALHAQSLYTPQAIVQGKYEMVGSNRTRVMDAVNKTRAEASIQTINAGAVVNGNSINIHYHLTSLLPKQQMFIALVQNKATTSVGRGENAGAQLTDYNIVRNLQMLQAQADGNLQINLPTDLKQDNASVILFAQDEATRHVITVTQLHL